MKKPLSRNTFVKIEILFFLCYFLLFPVLSDLEFNLREPGGNPGGVLASLPYRFISGSLHMLPYIVYYRFLLQKDLFQRRFFHFFLLLVVFLFLFNTYTALVDWLISSLNLPGSNFRSAQGIDFTKAVTMNFSVMYLLRELAVITALGYFIRSARQEVQIRELQHQQLHAELSYLKVQLQPHFFFNTLNNIYSLVLQGSPKAAPLVARHADIMRYILYDASGPSVSLTQEIAFLKNYIEVESVRYSDKLAITFETQGISDGARIEPLLLLPFIENTFKHGISGEIAEGYIRIIISLVENELTAEISNSTPPLGSPDGEPAGIGLKNVRKRLEALYPGLYNLQMEQDDTGYHVFLTVMLKPW